MSNFSFQNLISKDWSTADVYSSEMDILIAACTAWRLRKTNQIPSGVILDKTFKHTISSDEELAQKIRKYYAQKITIWALKSTKLSKFRVDLAEFINGDGLKYVADFERMVYKLPEFYHYDVELDEYIHQFCESDFQSINNNETLILEPKLKLLRATRYIKSFQYWFKSVDSKQPILLQVEKTNPLINIWESLFALRKPLVIEGKFSSANNFGFKHHRLENWKLLNTILID